MDKFLLLGLPNAGKSTFITSLNEVVSSGSSNTAFRRSAVKGDNSYINGMSREFRKGKRVPHTNVGSRHSVDLYLADSLGNEVPFSSPDMAGENFTTWCENRICLSHDWNSIASCKGLLLLINPEDITDLSTLQSANAALAKSPLDRNVNEDKFPSNIQASAVHDGFSTTAVSLVELLQFALLMIHCRPIALAIIISAWDLIEPHKFTPSNYVKAQLPLLWQFVSNNEERLRYEYFGLSAYGGSPSEGLSSDLLAKSPSERLFINAFGNKHSDPSIILEWLLKDEVTKP